MLRLSPQIQGYVQLSRSNIACGQLRVPCDDTAASPTGKIVDRSMDAISFRVPEGLTGRFILEVQNIIRSEYVLLDLGGSPSLMSMVWPDAYGQYYSTDNARGIYYNGQLYVFPLSFSTTEVLPKYFQHI